MMSESGRTALGLEEEMEEVGRRAEPSGNLEGTLAGNGSKNTSIPAGTHPLEANSRKGTPALSAGPTQGFWRHREFRGGKQG